MKVVNLIEQPELADSALHDEFAKDVREGLSADKKSISSKYLYDEVGSHLFKQITTMDDYYLTKTEMGIIESMKSRLPMFFDTYQLDILELGVGDGHKSSEILKAFLKYGCDITYYPIDISSAAFDLLPANMPDMAQYHIEGIVADYTRGLQYCKKASSRKKLVLFLGSNIGNFTPLQTQDFLSSIHQDLNQGDYILIGFDLKKDIDLLIKAYNDKQGITRDFNLNLLKRINRELGGNFNLDTFKHFPLYNPNLSAMESHLLSLQQQHVYIEALNMEVAFDYYEPIHLEFSFKFNTTDINRLAEQSGFQLVHNFIDEQGYFADSLWRVS